MCSSFQKLKFVKMSIKSLSLCIFQTGLDIILVKDLSARHMRIVTLSYDTRETNNQTFNCVFIHWCSNKDIHKISHLHTVAAWTQNQCNGGQSQLTNVPQKQLSRLR